jgi:lipid-A-disaccharide synthase
MRIFFSVGEPSGDQHAARLIRALKRRRPDLEFIGFGGPKMSEAGCSLNFPLTDLAVVGIFRVIPLLWKFYGLVKRAERLFREARPDAVVLVDFPGFNWWIARKAKAAGIPVFYYLPPQLWGWLSWRVRRMRKFVDHILCGLPFEPKWYADRGLAAEYVGHPFFDEVVECRLDEAFCHRARADFRRIVGILPGSRNHEVEANFPLQIDLMEQVAARHPDAHFLVACYKETHRERCRQLLAARPRSLPVELHVGRTPEIIEAADCCAMVSGSVSLEMLARAKPAVVVYRANPLTYALVRPLVHVKSITLPNLIAGRRLLPEWMVVLRPDRTVREMAAVVNEWIASPFKLAQVARELRQLRQEIGQPGATGRTADCILAQLAPPDRARAAA